MSVDNYPEWIQLVAQYTVQSLKAWQWASGSIHYLLGLWSRLVSSAAYLKGDAPSMLDTYAPRIIEAYVSSRRASLCAVPAGRQGSAGGACPRSAARGPQQCQVVPDPLPGCRLESVQLCMSSPAVDDPLENEEQLADQMDALPYMCRLQYAHTQEFLCGIMDPLIAAASERTASGARSARVARPCARLNQVSAGRCRGVPHGPAQQVCPHHCPADGSGPPGVQAPWRARPGRTRRPWWRGN